MGKKSDGRDTNLHFALHSSSLLLPLFIRKKNSTLSNFYFIFLPLFEGTPGFSPLTRAIPRAEGKQPWLLMWMRWVV